MKRIFLVLGIVLLTACGNTNYDHKALSNVHNASALVGGMSSDDRAAYALGVQHLENQHKRIGGYTITQVISVGNQVKDSQKAQADAALSAAATQGEKQDLESIFNLMNSSTSGKVVDSYSVEGNVLRVTVNGDVYEYLSQQDKDLMKQNIDNGWNISYNQRHKTKGEFTISHVYDEAGNRL